MLPAMSLRSGLPGYADEYYEPLWSACEDHGLVINLHTGASGTATDAKQLYDDKHGGFLGLYEVFVFTRRPLWFLIFGGVFDRHPNLKVVVTENGVQWLPSLIRDMESFFDTHGGAPVRSYLQLRPAEYFERHVFLGGSLMKRAEAEMREEIGVDRLMWGSDYPHLEGAAPVHRQILRHVFGGMPEEDDPANSRPQRGPDLRLRHRPVGQRSPTGSGRRWQTCRPPSRWTRSPRPSAGAWPGRCHWRRAPERRTPARRPVERWPERRAGPTSALGGVPVSLAAAF